MAKELPVNWSDIQQTVIAGVPSLEVAKAVIERTEGLWQKLADTKEKAVTRLYDAIRKKCSRERWPVPSSIIRRAQLQSRVAAGLAANAKDAACWSKGEPGAKTAAMAAQLAGVPQVPLDELETRLEAAGGAGSVRSADEANVTLQDKETGKAGQSGIVEAENGRDALREAPPLALDLVTEDLVTIGQRGLRSILSRSVAAAESMQQAPDVRSWQDVQTMTKVIQAAAGLDRPQVAVAVSLNSTGNATVAAWESA